MATTSSPLRYPGGKSRLSRYLSYLLRRNGLSDCSYVEPFAGGAGAALNLLRKEYVRTICLNDIDPGIYAFWNCVLQQTDAFCRLIADTPLTVDEWRAQRAILDDLDAERLQLGFATFYLNRTNRSGIIRGGVIGGLEQMGTWSMDARFNRKSLVEKVQQIASYRDRIKVSKIDAKDFLLSTVAHLPGRIFVYLDPPYYAKGQKLYHNDYDPEDHFELANILKTALRDKPWLLSYDDCPEIRAAYAEFPCLEYSIGYSAADRYHGGEIMFFSPAIRRPLLTDPLSFDSYASTASS